MKNIFIIITCLFLSGCSLIPKINFNTPNTVPQSVDKSKSKDVCKGKAEFNESGDMIFCSKGYYAYKENYNKEERKYTMKERLINILNNLKGWAFWITIGLIILCPSLLGLIAGRIIEGSVGVSRKVLTSVTTAVQKARKQGKDLNESLDAELDKKEKDYIKSLKSKEKIK